ncbi:hypothetical protein AmDm5_2466 [Acetobacter malorum]|nr:hypothetical protein AmDm5_2466 [Acetobacter malorum]
MRRFSHTLVDRSEQEGRPSGLPSTFRGASGLSDGMAACTRVFL